MEARFLRVALVATLLVSSLGASSRTTNFIVDAPTPALAQEIAQAAEKYRRDLAIEWLGKELPRWPQPCPISVQVGEKMGAGGATKFMFGPGPSGQTEAFGWEMSIQGSRERVLDSVLPHEVTHTIFATHFRRPLPRWADEGACTTVEHSAETIKQQQWLITFLKTNRGIPFDKMFAMREYPQDIMPLYAQGYSTARFLIAQGGRRKYVQFMETGFATDDWPGAMKKVYGYEDLAMLQNTWLEWVRTGSPDPIPEKFQSALTLASATRNIEQPAAVSQGYASNQDNANNRAYASNDAPQRDASRSIAAAPATNRTVGNAERPFASATRPQSDFRSSVAASGSSAPSSTGRLSSTDVASSNGTNRTTSTAGELKPLRRTRPSAGKGVSLVTNDGWSSRTPAGDQRSLSNPRPESVADRDVSTRQSSRPEATEEPRQLLLEWTRPTPAASPAATTGTSVSSSRDRVLR